MDPNEKATAPAAAEPKDTIEVETTATLPDSGDDKKVEKASNTEPNKAEPAKAGDAPEEPKKPINPRTLQRKQEKERILRENADLRARLDTLEKNSKPAEAKKKEFDPSVRPDITEYDDAIEYADHLSKHNIYAANKERDDDKAATEKQARVEAFEERAEVLRAEKPDFDEKFATLKASRLITDPMEKVILKSDIAPDIILHLANYGGDLMQLRGLPENLLPKAIKQLESFVKNPSKAPANNVTGSQTPRQTKAAPPITPVGSKSDTTTSVNDLTQEELENMPQHEFEAKYYRKT